MSTHDKLSALRNDAVSAWKIAINLTRHAADYTQPDETKVQAEDQASLAIMGAVNAQAKYTLAAQLCVQCGHRMIEHSVENPVRVPAEGWPPGFSDCGCCVRVGKARADNDDRVI